MDSGEDGFVESWRVWLIYCGSAISTSWSSWIVGCSPRSGSSTSSSRKSRFSLEIIPPSSRGSSYSSDELEIQACFEGFPENGVPTESLLSSLINTLISLRSQARESSEPWSDGLWRKALIFCFLVELGGTENGFVPSLISGNLELQAGAVQVGLDQKAKLPFLLKLLLGSSLQKLKQGYLDYQSLVWETEAVKS